MARVGIVTDSTCDLGPAWLGEHDVVMVPLKVSFGETTYLDWVDLTPEQFYEKLASSPVLPKTSQPSPADFVAVYERLADEGCEAIVSIHLTSALSGTHESAIMASQMVSVPVRVMDTRTVTMGTGLAVIDAVAARDAGGDADAVEAAARFVVEHGRLFFALDTLEYLVKGGRAGKAQGLAASLLNIKPVLTFNAEGTIEPYKKVKGTRKAIAEIAAAASVVGSGKIRVGILHSGAPELATELEAALRDAGIDHQIVHTVQVGAVIGTYAGLRAVGAVFCPVP
ncbi:MAG: DegV family protein [Coriobacteriia bacterium]